jgi:translocation and assembly module TamB
MSIFRKQVNSPNPENSSADRSRTPGRNWWKIGGIATASVLGVGAIGFLGLSTWVARNLSPTIAKELSKSLDRQVYLGKIQNIGLNEINFGASSLAPSQTSASRVAVKGINIRFDPLAVLWQRTLKPDVTILEPNLYLEQDAQGNWFKIPTQPPQKPGVIKTEIQAVHIRKARGTVVPFSTKKPINFQDIDISTNFQNKDGKIQTVNFNGNGQIDASDGTKNNQKSIIAIKGNSSLITQATHIEINGQGLNVAQARGLAKIPAMDFQRGLVDGNINVDLQPNQTPIVQGTLQVHQATFQIEQVPQLFQQASGTVKILPQAVQLQNVTTLYGQLPGRVAGSIDFERGYDLQAQIAPVPVALAVQALKVQSPVPIAGQVLANLALKGKLTEPVLSGQVQTVGAAQIDRLQFKQVASNFVVQDGKCLLNGISALPTLGGVTTGNGEITLTEKPQLRFNFQGNQLPANVLAKTYGQQLPIAMGLTSVTGQVFGSADRLTTDLQINAPQAAYPGSANLRISPQGNIQVQQARVKVAGQEIVGAGNADAQRWQMNVQVPKFNSQALAALASTAPGKIPQLPAFLAGQVSGQMLISGSTTGKSDSLQGQGQLQLQTKAGNIQATNFRLAQGQWQSDIQTNELLLAKIDPKLPGKLSGKFRVTGDLNKTSPETVQAIGSGAIVLGQGKIIGQKLTLAQGKWQGEFSSDKFDIGQLNPQAKGKLSGKFNLNGDIQKLTPNTIQGQGNGILHLPVGQVLASNVQLRGGKWQGEFTPENLEVSQFNPNVRGKLSGKFSLAGDLQKMDIANLQATGNGLLRNAGGGQLVAKQFQLQAGRWQSDLSLSALRLGSIDADLPKPWSAAVATGNFQVGGQLDRLTPASLNLSGNGRLNIGQGVITAQELKINDGKWQGLFSLRAIDLQQLPLSLARNLPAAQMDGQFQLAGQLQKPSVETAQGSARFQLPAGEIVANNLQLTGDQWHGEFQTKSVSLAQLPLPLSPGWKNAKLTSDFELSGNLKSFDTNQLTGSGSGQLELGAGRIDLTAAQIANGTWQGQFSAEQLDLPTVAKLLPNSMVSKEIQAGQLNATGQVAGNFESFDPAKLQVNSQISLSGLSLAKLNLEPNLTGQIQTVPGQGLNLLLAGQRDRIELNMGENNQPLQFAVRLADAVAQGQMVGNDLQVSTKNIPVGLLVSFLPPMPQIDSYRPSGLLGGNMSINLASGAVIGENIVVNQPHIGNIVGDKLQSKSLKYADGLLEVEGGEFRRGKNLYLLTARVLTNSKEPEYQVTVQVPQGQLSDVSNLFQIASINDLINPFGDREYGRASDLQPQSAGTELTTLQEQIDRLSEVKRLQVAKLEQQQDNPLPDLRKLEGDFTGTIAISNGSQSGSYASFNIKGNKWTVDQYQLAQVNMQGRWQNGVLNLAALDLLSTNAKIKVQGDFGTDQQTAQIEVEKFPIERLSTAFQLPVEIAGDVNLKAQLSGSWFDPQLSGIASIVDGKFNQSDVPVINTNFSYAKSRLKFDSNGSVANSYINPNNLINTINSSGESPIMISGSIPYKLPFALVSPTNNEVVLDLKLQGEGMKMLDVLTQQQALWMGGNGQVSLKAKGKLNQQNLTWNSANGTADLQDAVVKFNALSDNVTALNSNVIFDFDRVQVDKLEGKYGITPITAVGSIPINNLLSFSQPATCLDKSANISIPSAEQPLAVSFDNVQVNLKDQYAGGISGCVILGKGSITKPSIGGNIKLAKGKVILPSSGGDSGGDASDTTTNSSSTATSNENNPVQFQDLEVELGQDVTLEQFGLLSLLANGKLKLKGTIDRPIPTGQLNLPRGQFNLFTNKFRLTGDKNVAKFNGSTDANVNLNLSTKVLETSRLPVTVGNERREVSDTFSTSLGQVQSVQIEATIKELPLSQLKLDDAEFLRSKPPRSKDEILLLLSNGLGKITAGEEAVGNGLLSLAGTSLLSSFGDLQAAVGDLLGLSDFRLYPSFSQSPTSTTSTLGLAGEVGVNVSDSLSVSLFQILTGSDPPQYSVRYQINNQLLLRGSSNFSGDGRVLMEFEQRF